MAQITVQELYSGEKYGLMGKVVSDYMKHGRSTQIPEETWLDMLLIKHTVATIEEMKKRGRLDIDNVRWRVVLCLCGVGR